MPRIKALYRIRLPERIPVTAQPSPTPVVDHDLGPALLRDIDVTFGSFDVAIRFWALVGPERILGGGERLMIVALGRLDVAVSRDEANAPPSWPETPISKAELRS